MSAIPNLIEALCTRPDLSVVASEVSWLISISKGDDYVCEVVVPRAVLEWFASVKHRGEKKPVWEDWMDYEGYDDRPREQLESEMAADILAFVNRTSFNELRLPLSIYERQVSSDANRDAVAPPAADDDR
jgi:hypothetical protein